jgi:hypothetical protein
MAVAAATASSLPWPGTASAGSALTPTRRATYIALFTLVHDVNRMPVGSALVETAVARFEADYANTGASNQAYINEALDAIEASEPGGLSRAPATEQVGLLRSWRYAPFATGPASRDVLRRRSFAAEALTWATSPSALTSDFKVEPLPI